MDLLMALACADSSGNFVPANCPFQFAVLNNSGQAMS